MVTGEWHTFDLCDRSLINLGVCLDHGGQSFTWLRTDEEEWVNVIGSVPVAVGYKGSRICYSVEHESEGVKMRETLWDYFNLDHDLEDLYGTWSSSDRHFEERSSLYPGIRLLRQDPVETLFAFICSQNNGIARITKMVLHLKSAYGKPVGSYRGQPLFAFPAPDALTGSSISGELASAGFGYRAKYIHGCAMRLCEQGISLHSLRKEAYDTAIESLLQFPGIGPKVADCIALMSLDKHEAVPIDTHIWQVASKHYRMVPAAKTKSLTRAAYLEIASRFRQIFGARAGWAHLVLFASQSRLKQGRSGKATIEGAP